MIEPDKIYCGNNGHGNLSYSQEKVYPSMKEYIRKDAILKWAKEIAENASWVSIDGLIEKINAL